MVMGLKEPFLNGWEARIVVSQCLWAWRVISQWLYMELEKSFLNGCKSRRVISQWLWSLKNYYVWWFATSYQTWEEFSSFAPLIYIFLISFLILLCFFVFIYINIIGLVILLPILLCHDCNTRLPFFTQTIK